MSNISGVFLTFPPFLPAAAACCIKCTYVLKSWLLQKEAAAAAAATKERKDFVPPSPSRFLSRFLASYETLEIFEDSTSSLSSVSYMGDNKGGTTGQDNPANWMNLNTPPPPPGGGSNDNVVIDVPSKDFSRQQCVNVFPTSSAVNVVMHAADSARDIIPRDELVAAVRGIHNLKGISELERGILYNSSRNDSEASNNTYKDNALEATQSAGQRLNNNNGKAPMSLSRFMQSDEEKCSVPVVKEEEALSLSSHDGGESSKVCEPPTVTVAVPGLRSSQEVPSGTSMFKRMRSRSRITELLRSLQELLPHFEGRGRESVLDATIDYVKCLQLQFKTLSQSRLGGEASHGPFVYLEGYGHYLFHDEMPSSPLEEIIGQLMEVNMPLLYQLLESKGLAVMPMGLAGGLLQ